MTILRNGSLATKSVVMVTHHVDEAIEMADRISVLSGRPPTVACEIPVDVNVRSCAQFKEYVYHQLEMADKD